MSNLHEDFIQVRIWEDCVNNCDFCYLRNHRHKTTTLDHKKARLAKTQKHIENLLPNRAGLIGGDFFEGQLRGCEKEWISLIESMSEKGINIFITANLIHSQYYLNETIEKQLRGGSGNLVLCTSYDEVGRFHTEADRKNWLNRIESLHESGVDVVCTCIPTQDFLESNFELPEWLNIDLCDPHVSREWFSKIDHEKYNECLRRDNNCFNLPKRQTAVKWLRTHTKTTKKYANYSNFHSNTVYGFDENDQLFIEIDDRWTSDNFNNPKCGHPYASLCYADSDKCMMCDAVHIAGL